MILTGTPAGSRPVEPGDVVEVEIEGVGRVRNAVVEAPEQIPGFGAQPRVSPAVRAAAWAIPEPRPVTLSEACEGGAAQGVDRDAHDAAPPARDPATRSWAGLRPTRPDLRLLGYAHTLRYVPLREDVAAAATGAERPEARRRVDRARRTCS